MAGAVPNESALQLIAVSVSLQDMVELGRPFGFCLNGKMLLIELLVTGPGIYSGRTGDGKIRCI